MGGGPAGAPPAGARCGARRSRGSHLLACPLSALARAPGRSAWGGAPRGGDGGREEVGGPACDSAQRCGKACKEGGECGAGEGRGAGGRGASARRGPPPDDSCAAATGTRPAPGRTDHRPPMEDALGRGRVLAPWGVAANAGVKRYRPAEGEMERRDAARKPSDSLRLLPRPRPLSMHRPGVGSWKDSSTGSGFYDSFQLRLQHFYQFR